MLDLTLYSHSDLGHRAGCWVLVDYDASICDCADLLLTEVERLREEERKLLTALGDNLVQYRFDKRYPKWIADRLEALS